MQTKVQQSAIKVARKLLEAAKAPVLVVDTYNGISYYAERTIDDEFREILSLCKKLIKGVQ